jgi:CBS domain containing-hemolysin-like protein
MLLIFPIVFATVYITTVAGILYAGLMCGKQQEEESDEEESDNEKGEEEHLTHDDVLMISSIMFFE